MKTLEQIRTRLLDNSVEEPEKRALRMGLGQNLPELVTHMYVVYNMAIEDAVRHRINDNMAQEAFSIAWVLGSKTNYSRLPYFQYNLPRLRMIAREFLFTWPNKPFLWRMAEGLPCNEYCLHCNGGRANG